MIPKCPQCGATVPQDAHVCPYCQAPTAYGIAMRQRADEDARQRAAWAEAAKLRDVQAGRDELEQISKQSLMWSAAAVVLCCVPGPQIMGIVRFLNARTLAKKLGVDVPGSATAGGAISIASIALGIGLIVLGAVVDN